MGHSAYLVTLIASILVSVALTIFFLRRHPSPGARIMAGIAAMTAVWSLGYVVEVTTDSLSGFQLAADIEYIGFTIVPVLWFMFAVRYTEYENWLTRHWYLLFIIPSLTLILVWTNDLHGWVWYNARLANYQDFLVRLKTYGPWFWVHTVYSYSLVLAGIGILATRLFYPHNLYRNQVIILMAAIIIPAVWNMIYIFRAAPTYQIDMTPPAFVLSGIIIALGIFRFNIFRIVPIARNKIVENMNDAVIVLDRQNRIVDLNQAAEKIIGQLSRDLLGKPVSLILMKLPELKNHLHNTDRLQGEIHIDGTEHPRNYEITLFPLFGLNKEVRGRVIILHDITDRKKLEQSLKEYAQRITQVQEEERKRIAFELHDDTAQYLSILKMQLGALLQSEKIKDPEVKDKLEYLEKDADRAFNDVRRYSHELRPGVLDHLGLRAALEQIVEDINKIGQLTVELDAEGEEPALPDDMKLGLFRITQEALNNARKHSKADRIFINLSFKDNKLKLTVKDTGAGFDVNTAAAKSGKKGSLGLMSMRERAILIGGDLKIESEPGKGTTVTVEVRL